jgi:hypothetical protein
MDDTLARLWQELEAYTKTALEWPSISAVGVWDDHNHYVITKLENEIEKVRASAVGRGLAIAIQLLDPTAYGDSTAVVNEAVRRYTEQK